MMGERERKREGLNIITATQTSARKTNGKGKHKSMTVAELIFTRHFSPLGLTNA